MAKTVYKVRLDDGMEVGPLDGEMIRSWYQQGMVNPDTALRAQGIGFCNITKCCTKVCPEGITITDNAIIPLKERVVDRFYDPVTRLFRALRARG